MPQPATLGVALRPSACITLAKMRQYRRSWKPVQPPPLLQLLLNATRNHNSGWGMFKHPSHFAMPWDRVDAATLCSSIPQSDVT